MSHKIGFRADIFLSYKKLIAIHFFHFFLEIESGIMRTQFKFRRGPSHLAAPLLA